jgi:cystathionine beta-synthase
MNKKIKENILECIGNTPIVRLNRVTSSVEANIYAKVEFFNPGGSIKDRIALSMIEKAEKEGKLKPGGTIVECTSGNTGMGLAIAAAIKGYKCIFVMPDKMSMEKVMNLRAFGAKVIQTPTAVSADDPRSHYSVARRIAAETPNAVLMDQYNNLANRMAHIQTTGPEIYDQMDGKVDAVIAGMGTGGTITGIAMYLKEKNKNIKIVGADPVGSILYEYFHTGKIGEAKPYKVEGIGEDIIPQNMDFNFYDDIIQVTDKESMQMTRRLLLEEGLYVGPSAGSAVVAAIKYAKKIGGGSGKNFVVILPDSGNRYMSKVFNDDWMKENGFLDSGLGTVRDLINTVKPGLGGNLITVQEKDEIEKVVKIMSEKGVSQLPVLRGSELLGLVSESNLLSSLFSGKVKSNDRVEKVVDKNYIVVNFDDDVELLSQNMSRQMVPIVMDGKTLVTIITKIDLINYIGIKKKGS